MRNIQKTTTLESKFPLLAVEHGCIVSKDADITVAYEVTLPEVFTVTSQEYEAVHAAWCKAMKVLPDFSVVHKQDWFVKERYAPDLQHSDMSFLSRSYERHFNERPYLHHRCYLFLTKTTRERMARQSTFSTLCRGHIVPKEVKDKEAVARFLDAVEQFARIVNDSGFVSLRRLTDEEITGTERTTGLVGKYLSLSTENVQCLEDMELSARGMRIGNKHLCLHTLSQTEDLPTEVSTDNRFERLSTDRSDCRLSFAAPVGLLLSCNHIYNQYVFIDNSDETLQRFEKTARNMHSLSRYSRQNAINKEWIDEYLNEAHSQGLQSVRAHFNVMAWGEDMEELKHLRNDVGSQLASMECVPRHNTVDCPTLFWAAIPGNEGDFPSEESFHTFIEQATCLFTEETNYMDSPSPFGIKMADRISGKPLHIDISDLPMKKGVITNRNKFVLGLSGSGKSSLAFDTIFAEGQRRYIDTFSSYARGYIGNMQRPDVDKITGLSPVISIDQKTTGKNPRSTVGTITEIYDFLRLLYARAGVAYSYLTGEKMVHYTDDQIISLIQHDYAGKKIVLLAPLVNNRKGHYKELFETIRKKGYVYVRVDGEVQEVTLGMKVDRYKNHTIEVVIDRLVPPADAEQADEADIRRLRQSVDKAMTQGQGIMLIAEWLGKGATSAPRYFSRNLMCPTTGLSYQDPAPHSFSFNSPQGWCPCCKGLGKISKEAAANTEQLDDIVHDDTDWYKRMLEYVQQQEEQTDTDESETIECPECHGKRLNREALSYRIADKTIADLAEMDIDKLLLFLTDATGGILADLTNQQRAVAEPILKEIVSRLQFMQSVGLSYLSLGRNADSLSGGESQRIRLATQIGSRLVNVLYILDEPSIGLHQRDNDRLIHSLKELRDMGNSVIVVEHDEQMMREADYIVDIGPKAGRLGGQVVFAGTPAQMLQADTLTARYLRGECQVQDTEKNAEQDIEQNTGENIGENIGESTGV